MKLKDKKGTIYNVASECIYKKMLETGEYIPVTEKKKKETSQKEETQVEKSNDGKQIN